MIPTCPENAHAHLLTVADGAQGVSRGRYGTGIGPSVEKIVRLEGFEPPTLGSVDRCSNPLSYSRVVTGPPS
jgi:hypothetical protein